MVAKAIKEATFNAAVKSQNESAMNSSCAQTGPMKDGLHSQRFSDNNAVIAAGKKIGWLCNCKFR